MLRLPETIEYSGGSFFGKLREHMPGTIQIGGSETAGIMFLFLFQFLQAAFRAVTWFELPIDRDIYHTVPDAGAVVIRRDEHNLHSSGA